MKNKEPTKRNIEKAFEIYEHATEVAVGLAMRGLEKDHQLYRKVTEDGRNEMQIDTKVMEMHFDSSTSTFSRTAL